MTEVRTNERCPGCGGVLFRELIRERGVNDSAASEALGIYTRCSGDCILEVDAITGEVSATPRP